MICRLLSSDPNLCFDKVQEKISIFSENEYLLEVTSNQTSLQQHSRKRPSILTAFKLCCVLRQARLLSVWLVAGPCLRHCRLTAVPKRIQYVADYYYYVPPAPPPSEASPSRAWLPVYVQLQGFKFIISVFLNFNFEICDSMLKLEWIGINLPVNLNLRSKFKLNLLCSLDGSTAVAQRLSGSGKGQADSSSPQHSCQDCQC